MPQEQELLTRLAKLIQELPPQEAKAQAFLNSLIQGWEQQGPSYLTKIAHELRYYTALLHILKEINTEKEVTRLLYRILDTAIDLTGAERGFLLLEDREVARHFDGDNILGDYKISRSLADLVRKSSSPFVTDHAQEDSRVAPFESIRLHRAMSILCLPIVSDTKTMGVIYLDNRIVAANFQQHHVRLLTAFAEQMAQALQNASLNRELCQRSQKIHLLNVELRRKLKKQSRKLESVRQQLQTWNQPYRYHDIYGTSPNMHELFSILEKIKDYDLPVLIQGESGTGKELIARAIHQASTRRDFPLVCENCAAIPEPLFESELFGHEKGAFSGAVQQKKGLVEEAQQGTLFLDEVGELSLESQKKLLRVLAEKQVRRVGGHEVIAVDVRILAATNCDMKKMVADGKFREDLFYRLLGISITVPPLRDRREDIPLLVEHFLEEAANLTKESPKKVDKSLLSVLIGYDWPGNIRQLRNEILRLAALSAGPSLDAVYLSPDILPASPAQNLEKVKNLSQLLRDMEKREILKALHLAEQNKSRAAQFLGISRFTLQRKLEKYGLDGK